MPHAPQRILETVLYTHDLDTTARFYADIIGLTESGRMPGRQVFFRLANQMLLLFNPVATSQGPLAIVNGVPMPRHGTSGQGHMAFVATESEVAAWHAHFESLGIPIDADVNWPGGGRSIYVRDPAGNSVEFATPTLWGLE